MFSFVNSVIGYIAISWMLRNKVSYFFIPLLLSNFYVLVLFFPAERLKVGVLFLLLASWSTRFKFGFYFLAIISHMQTAVLVLGMQIIKLHKAFLRLREGFLTKELVVSGLALIALALVSIPLFDHLVGKITYYMDRSGGFDEMLKPLAFLLLTIYYADRKFVAFLASLQIVLLSMLVGADRLVMFSYFLFLYFGLKVNRGINVGVIITSLYFTYKGIMFIRAVLECGNAFVC